MSNFIPPPPPPPRSNFVPPKPPIEQNEVKINEEPKITENIVEPIKHAVKEEKKVEEKPNIKKEKKEFFSQKTRKIVFSSLLGVSVAGLIVCIIMVFI